jgi:AraC-like DNA-binding protein
MSVEHQPERYLEQSNAGRKPKQDSRAPEFRRRLIIWKQTSDSLRPSLRALAKDLHTSHQLLRHYLDGLDQWIWHERQRKAKQEAESIRQEAKRQGRPMTQFEEQRAQHCDWAASKAFVTWALLEKIARLGQKARRGPLHSLEVKLLQDLGKRGFPNALEIASTCRRKQKKTFTAIVRETRRQTGETPREWVRRIYDECNKYETRVPDLIEFDQLVRMSHRKETNVLEKYPHVRGLRIAKRESPAGNLPSPIAPAS